MATNHTCTTYMDDREYTFHFLCTDASNIQLVDLMEEYGSAQKLPNTDYLGINGSYFQDGEDEKQILNIAMQDGNDVGNGVVTSNSFETVNAGTTNTIGSGAVAWNGSKLSCYTNVVDASDISFSGNSGTWIQGGFALWLGYGQWRNKFLAQPCGDQYIDTTSCRSALIADMNKQEVYLVMTTFSVTVDEFRTAIQDFLGISDNIQANNTYQGILLDGGRSSQLKGKNSSNTIRSMTAPLYRAVPQIIALKNNN